MKKYWFLVLFILLSGIAHASSGDGRKTVTTAGTRVQITTAKTIFSQLSICAERDNTGVITVGGLTVVASLSTRTGIPLEADDCYTIGFGAESGGDVSEVYIDSTVSTDGVTYHWMLS